VKLIKKNIMLKNLIASFAFILLIIGFVSCGDDDSTGCAQADFVGTYTIVGDTICTTDNTISAPLSFFLTSGPSENIVLENGEDDLELTIVDCVASDDFVSYTLDGNNMTTKIGNCEWSYTKN